MREAIEQCGIENFKSEILETNLTKDFAFEREKYYIALFDSTNPDKGYNTCKYKSGHSAINASRFRGHHHSIESKQKTSKSLKGRKISDETRQLMSKNHALRTPIKCLELNEVFYSLNEAERVLKIDRHRISKVLDTDETVKNLHFIRLERR